MCAPTSPRTLSTACPCLSAATTRCCFRCWCRAWPRRSVEAPSPPIRRAPCRLLSTVSAAGATIPASTAPAPTISTALIRCTHLRWNRSRPSTWSLTASPASIYDPLTGAANGTGRQAFPGNLIPASRIDPGIQAVLNLGEWPNPNIAGTGAFGLARDYFSQGTSGQNRNQVDSKLTWNPDSKLGVFARFGINDNSWFNPQQYGALGGPGFSPANSSVGIGAGFIYSGTLSG